MQPIVASEAMPSRRRERDPRGRSGRRDGCVGALLAMTVALAILAPGDARAATSAATQGPARDLAAPERTTPANDGTATLAAPIAACPRCVADFAIYDPAYEGDGVWEDDVTALTALMDASGFTWRRVDANDILAGRLGSSRNRRFRALVEPGGWAWWRNVALGTSGAARVRAFVRGGGGYLGFCAGAYDAVATVSFDLYDTGYYQSYAYELALFDGAGQGPFGWVPWQDGTGIDLAEAAIDVDNPTMAAIGLPARTRFLYGGGPWLVPSGAPPTGWEVWVRAVAPPEATNRDGDGQPAIVRFLYGKGNVVLFAYHPEILVGSDADHVVLGYPYDESTLLSRTGDLTIEQIDRDSWNIAHAALQVVSGRAPTPFTSLPER
jgi:glutamine amidotransferase-like uncharacterized protein